MAEGTSGGVGVASRGVRTDQMGAGDFRHPVSDLALRVAAHYLYNPAPTAGGYYGI